MYTKHGKFLAQCPKKLTEQLFFQKTIFPPNVPMDRKKVFFETSWKIFPRKAKTFSLNVRKRWKNIIQKIDPHKYPIVSVYAVLTNTPKFSSQSPRWVWNSYYFSKVSTFIFPQYVPMDTRNAVITTLLTRFRRKVTKNFRSMWKNGKKTYI